MRLIVQRVKQAFVEVDQTVVGNINHGFLVYVGIHHLDTESTAVKMALKVHNLRVFEDENGKMNLNLDQVGGAILAVSQFTLYGDTKGNNRPAFIDAARPEIANPLFNLFVQELSKYHHIEKGVFGAHMQVSSINDGPVTILIEM